MGGRQWQAGGWRDPGSQWGRVAGVRRIVVLHARGLGDLMFALPALHALRDAYPDADMTLLGAPWYESLLCLRPGPVDHVETLPVDPGSPDAATVVTPQAARFFAAQQRNGYDLAVQLQGGGRTSNPLMRRLGARVTIGACTADALPLDRWIPFRHYQHEVLRALEVVDLVGAAPTTLEPVVTVTPADNADSMAVVAPSAAPLVVLHPGAGDPRRRWPATRFAQLGDALADAGARVVVTGSAEERAITAAVTTGMRAPVQDTAGALSLSALVGLLSRAALVVANDSGPLHLAQAVGSRTVGLYWCGNVINAGAHRRSANRVAISWQLECSECGVDCTQGLCSHRSSFLLRIDVDEVCVEALDLLAGVAADGEVESVSPA